MSMNETSRQPGEPGLEHLVRLFDAGVLIVAPGGELESADEQALQLLHATSFSDRPPKRSDRVVSKRLFAIDATFDG